MSSDLHFLLYCVVYFFFADFVSIFSMHCKSKSKHSFIRFFIFIYYLHLGYFAYCAQTAEVFATWFARNT